MTDAERQRKRRAALKADPIKHAEYKLKERQRWKQRVSEKRIRTFNQLSAREQRCQLKNGESRLKNGESRSGSTEKD